jgi:hypothetical protein
LQGAKVEGTERDGIEVEVEIGKVEEKWKTKDYFQYNL